MTFHCLGGQAGSSNQQQNVKDYRQLMPLISNRRQLGESVLWRANARKEGVFVYKIGGEAVVL